MTVLGISKDCHGVYNGGGGHTACKGYMLRPRLGVLPAVEYIHHPQPEEGDSLTHTTARCACPCHKGHTTPPPPGASPPVDTPT